MNTTEMDTSVVEAAKSGFSPPVDTRREVASRAEEFDYVRRYPVQAMKISPLYNQKRAKKIAVAVIVFALALLALYLLFTFIM